MSPRIPIMLVDGYNVVGAWSSLQNVLDSGNLEMARDQLVEIMTSFSAYRGFKTTLVFDAYNNPSPAVTEKVTEHLNLHYTEYRQTADSYIEKMCAQLRRLRRVIVVTSDRAQQLTATGFGAEWMSAGILEQEVRLTEQMVRNKQRSKAPTSRRLHSVMDDDTRRKLTDWRSKLNH